MKGRLHVMKLYKTKLIKSGDVIEVYQYEVERAVGYKSKKTVIPKETKYVDPETGEILTDEQVKIKNRQKNSIRQKMNLIRLANTNFRGKDVRFLTLTFRENLQDIEKANKIFNLFIKHLNYQLKKKGKPTIKYLVVIEFQKRGAIHYHALTKMSFTRVEIIRECWRKASKEFGGNIDIKRVDRVDNVGAYISKYMSKNNEDLRLSGKKQYWSSRNLEKPIEVVGDQAESYIEKLGLKTKKIAYESSWTDEYTGGKVQYKQYNLRRQ